MGSTLAEVLDTLGRVLNHVPYAVCGLAAMAAYGFTGRAPTHVSIMCPDYSKDVIRSWAAAAGLVLFDEGAPDMFGLRTTDGRLRRVRLKYIDPEGFEVLRTVAATASDGGTGARVLVLPALVDHVAKAYIAERDPRRNLPVLEGDVLWLLRRIAEDADPRQRLTAEQVPHVANPLFWDIFCCTYPDATELFARAGLDCCSQTAGEFAPQNTFPSSLDDGEEEEEDWVPDWLAGYLARGGSGPMLEAGKARHRPQAQRSSAGPTAGPFHGPDANVRTSRLSADAAEIHRRNTTAGACLSSGAGSRTPSVTAAPPRSRLLQRLACTESAAK
jgi:hypothetical protein